MVRRSPPLITRLRRCLPAAMWFALFVMLTKVAIAAACLTDEPRIAARSPAAEVVVSAPCDDGAPAACWHAAHWGCHCGCAHSSALPVAGVGLCPGQWRNDAFSESVPRPFLTPRERALRPPIA